MALLGTEAVGAGVWFGLPHAQIGVDLFKIKSESLSSIFSKPIFIREGGFWLSRTSSGLLALSPSCPYFRDRWIHYQWVDANSRFECPACGSKYSPDGTKIPGEGPAQRDLDRFEIIVKAPSGDHRTSKDGRPVDIHDATQIVVNINRKILGAPAKTIRR